MRKLILTLGLLSFVLAFSTISFAQGVQVITGPSMSLDKDVHDYGKIKKDSDGACFFTITNSGTEPLLITNAKGSCGCTVPEWPKTPIANGEEAAIKVTFNSAGKSGKQNKTVTLVTNAIPNTKVITINGNVIVPQNK